MGVQDCTMNIVGIGVEANSGKGEVAKILVNRFGFARVSFADEIKRTVRRWWPNFTIEELWGASEMRNRVHPEYGGLTARKACQFIGTEIGRELDRDLWARTGLETAKSLLAGGCYYEPARGLTWSASCRKADGVCFDDMRFLNELQAIRDVQGKTWKIVRPSSGLQGEAGQHASENSLKGHDNHFDAIIVNNKSLAELEDIVTRIATATL